MITLDPCRCWTEEYSIHDPTGFDLIAERVCIVSMTIFGTGLIIFPWLPKDLPQSTAIVCAVGFFVSGAMYGFRVPESNNTVDEVV